MKKKESGTNPKSAISRRDFVGGTLIGSGAALLGAASPVLAQKIVDGATSQFFAVDISAAQ